MTFFENEQIMINYVINTIKTKKTDGIFIDVGARVGEWTNLLIEHFPNEKFLCFEPDKIACEVIRNKNNSNIEIFNCGLSDENKKLLEKVDEYEQVKADLNDKNKTVHSQESNVVALRDKIKNMSKQHQEELEHHGRTIDDYQRKIKEKEKMIETMGEEVKILKSGKKKKRSKKLDVKHSNS